MEGAGMIEERERKQCAAGLAQAEPEIEERRRFQRFQHTLMAGFGGTVSEQERWSRRGRRPHQPQYGRGDDEAVDQDGHSALRGAGSGPEERGNVAAAKAANGLLGAWDPAHPRQGVTDDRTLARKSYAGHAGASSDQCVNLVLPRFEEHRNHGGGGSGVANPHLAQDQDEDTVGQRVDRAGAGHDGAGERRFAHRVFDPQIADRVSSHWCAHEANVTLVAEIAAAEHADVDDVEWNPQLLRQHARRRAAGDEVPQHRCGDLHRVRRDTVACDRVVGGEEDGRGGARGRHRRALQPGELHRDLLEHAEAAAGLGEALLVLAGQLGRSDIEGRGGHFHGLAPALKSTPTTFPAMKLLTTAWSSSSGRMFQGFDPSPVFTSPTSILAGSCTERWPSPVTVIAVGWAPTSTLSPLTAPVSASSRTR